MHIHIFKVKEHCKLQIKLHIDLMGVTDSYEESPVRHFYLGGEGGTKSSHPLCLALLLSLLIDSNNNKDDTIFVGNQRRVWEMGNQISSFLKKKITLYFILLKGDEVDRNIG